MNNRIRSAIFRKPAVAGFLLIILIFQNDVSAQTGWYFNSSVQFSGGNYIFDSYSRVFSIYSGLRYQSENYGISVSLPLVANNNNNLSQSGGMMIPSGNNSGTSNSSMQGSMNLGLGDLYGYFDYRILSEFENDVDLYINAQVKIPTAATLMNIGTDQYDFGASISLRKSFNTFLGVVDIGYLNIGDPSSISYKNPITYGLGFGKFFNYGEYLLLLYYTGYTKILDEYDAPQQVSLGGNYRASETIIVSLISSAGIGNFAPDFTLSGGIRIKL